MGKPALTEENLPDQQGKVFMVTGATSGVGQELATILYAHNATVYLAARSSQKATATIQHLKSTYPKSTGSATFLKLDPDHLTTIKNSAQEFLSKETRLDVLWNKAIVMTVFSMSLVDCHIASESTYLEMPYFGQERVQSSKAHADMLNSRPRKQDETRI